MSTALLTALLFVLPLAPAAATPTPRVVVLQASGQPDQSGFVEALQIQLAGTGEVVAGAPLADGPLAARVAAAGEAARAAGALLAVWVERASAPGGEDVVLYVVGEADGRAVVQVFRLPEGAPADTDRALALKVGSAVDELLAPAAQVVLAPDSEVAKEVKRATEPLAARGSRLLFGGELRVGSSGGDRGVAGEAGFLLGMRRPRYDAYVELRFGSGDRWSNAVGDVRTIEGALALGMRYVIQPIGMGVRLEGGVRFVNADGTSAAGATGSGDAALGFVASGIERHFSAGSADLVLGLVFELGTAEKVFTINEQSVARLDNLRGFLSLSALWRGL